MRTRNSIVVAFALLILLLAAPAVSAADDTPEAGNPIAYVIELVLDLLDSNGDDPSANGDSEEVGPELNPIG